MFNAGETILIETNYDKGGYRQAHLFVIVLDTDKYTQLTIIIPIDTIRGQKHDNQTPLESGCHKFITSDSYVNYRRARKISTDDLGKLINQGKAKKRDPCSQIMLEKIRDGILKSAFTPMEIREMYESYLFESL